MAQRRPILPLTIDDVESAAGAATPAPSSRPGGWYARTIRALSPLAARWIPDWWVNLRQWVHETWTERAATAAQADGVAEWMIYMGGYEPYDVWSVECCMQWRDCLMGNND